MTLLLCHLRALGMYLLENSLNFATFLCLSSLPGYVLLKNNRLHMDLTLLPAQETAIEIGDILANVIGRTLP